jgi:hypothetical protein
LPLAQQFPDRKVVALFFDEPTPNEIYRALDEKIVSVETLFKWGYGTGGNTKVIEGEEYAKTVFGFPFPGDIKPIADLVTREGYQPNIVVLDLLKTFGSHGAPYLKLVDEKPKCLFPLNPRCPEFRQFGVYGSRAAPLSLPQI